MFQKAVFGRVMRRTDLVQIWIYWRVWIEQKTPCISKIALTNVLMHLKQSKIYYSLLGAHSLWWKTGMDNGICQSFVAGCKEFACLSLRRVPEKKYRKGKKTFVQFLFFSKCSSVLRIPAIILFTDSMYKIYHIHIFNKESDWKTPNKLKTAIGNSEDWEAVGPPWKKEQS